MGVTYGYVRVSTRDQNEARQVLAMLEYGIDEGHIYIDRQSGKDFDRPEYQKLLKALRTGDVLVVKSIDRLGRSYDQILDQWRTITKEKDCDIVVLDMPLLDTTRDQAGGLMGKVIADIVLQLLSYVAQTEREFTRQRQAEGIAAAKARGQKFGPKPKERPSEYFDLYQRWRGGTLSASQAGKLLKCSRNTFLRWAREDAKKEATPWQTK